MQSAKPIIAEGVIRALLNETFRQPIQAFTPFEGGQISRVFSFQVDDTPYILRFATDSLGAGYHKDAFVYEQFTSPGISIPEVVKIGRIEETPYAISKQKRGQTLISLTREDYRKTLPSIIKTLHAIHQVDVSDRSGFGPLDSHGAGQLASWDAFISNIIAEEEPGSFYGKWHSLFETTFLDRDFFEQVYAHMLKLLAYHPGKRYLVHGDFGYDNVLAADEQVTAVLDWANVMYGDFVYDIAYVGFWRPGSDLVEQYRQYYASQGTPLPNFWERIACYSCYGGLNAMRFFAKTDNLDAYKGTCAILQNFLPDKSFPLQRA